MRRLLDPAQLLNGVFASLATFIIILILRASLGERLNLTEKFLVVIGLLAATYILGAIVRRTCSSLLVRIMTPTLRRQMEADYGESIKEGAKRQASDELGKRTGIVSIYASFRECEQEILSRLTEAKDVRIFLQLGRTVWAATADFYEQLAKKIKRDAEVRILHASPESPYLSREKAHSRGSNYSDWETEADFAVKKIATLSENHAAKLVEGRQHAEGFLWRLFILDDLVFMQPYLYDRNNSNRAPVFKIDRRHSGEENENSLYRAFRTYFDDKWEENLPQVRRLDELIAVNELRVVAAALQYHQFFVFAVPKRYIDRDSSELPFHGVGGKVGAGEVPVDALRREALEELGTNVDIRSSGRTRYFATGVELEPIQLEDRPRPYCVYHRTRPSDPSFAHEDVLWMIGYEAVAPVKSLDHLRPGSEIGAILIITSDTLRRTLDSSLSYSDIESQRDGSRLILRDGINFDRSRIATPSGLATIVAGAQKERWTRRLR